VRRDPHCFGLALSRGTLALLLQLLRTVYQWLRLRTVGG
jgi:hypothetical protein